MRETRGGGVVVGGDEVGRIGRVNDQQGKFMLVMGGWK